MDEPAVTDEHRADVYVYGRTQFLDVDASIRLFSRLGSPGGDWRAWEWPRRLAALENRYVQSTLGDAWNG